MSAVPIGCSDGLDGVGALGSRPVRAPVRPEGWCGGCRDEAALRGAGRCRLPGVATALGTASYALRP